jgi:hypothetical protein
MTLLASTLSKKVSGVTPLATTILEEANRASRLGFSMIISMERAG